MTKASMKLPKILYKRYSFDNDDIHKFACLAKCAHLVKFVYLCEA